MDIQNREKMEKVPEKKRSKTLKHSRLLMKDDIILMSHGDGGLKSSELISNVISKYIRNDILDRFEDSAVVRLPGKKIAFTTDSFVINPIFFPGGDIGKLSICGTVNDLAASGAEPYFLSFSLILEEGFPVKDLEKIMKSVSGTIDEINGVSPGSRKGETNNLKLRIITGDTKVVEKGSADKIYINTAGIGLIDEEVNISPSRIETGDIIIVSGTIGDHGIAVLSKRKEFDFKTALKSDCAPLSPLVAELIAASKNIHAIRDATRGGLARVLFELALASKHDFEISNGAIPIKRETRGICEFLGMDPLYVANEGKMVFFVSSEDAFSILKAARNNKYGKDACIIGKVTKKGSGRVILDTEIGTKRLLDLYYSEQLPRIC
jgi:hydrogenase expression/formation protein HypE